MHKQYATRNAITAAKKQCDDQVAIEQARFIQLKVEFENYKREMSDKITEAAAQNLSFQDQIDDLQEQLNQCCQSAVSTVAESIRLDC
jgi:hypothetical protein